jgi:RNA polymerase subunit RPABC4/transcription elongation factor Spt4
MKRDSDQLETSACTKCGRLYGEIDLLEGPDGKKYCNECHDQLFSEKEDNDRSEWSKYLV